MGFQKGNKLSPGGKKGNKGGRSSKEKLKICEEVKRLVELELEKHVMAVIGAGRKIATGVKAQEAQSEDRRGLLRDRIRRPNDPTLDRQVCAGCSQDSWYQRRHSGGVLSGA